MGALLFSGFMDPPEPPSPGAYVFTPLHLAAKLGRLELLPLLLKVRPDSLGPVSLLTWS